ncbi:MAG TPA: PBSX family phage terminase large subunit [Gammaproteobacteria bacterium]|nr:PBSX family phage terminase large subunit [Gammaproteobacteria bacterium]
MNAINQEQFKEPGLELSIPAKLGFLYTESARFKILEGGRGGGKTEGIARVLLALASCTKLRILCAREIQDSIEESVHSTLKNCIYEIWPNGSWISEWDIQANKIISKRTGSEFIYSGLRYKLESIKSIARIDICWIEEARKCSKTTLDKIFPTIRGKHDDDPNGQGGPFGKGPEIWISFNPELDDDEIYLRITKYKEKYFPDYVKNKDGELVRYAIICKINYYDNPFFPEDLRQQMEIAKRASELDENDTDYLHVWEGHTKQVLDGAIYAKEIKKAILEGRRKRVPHNPNKPVLTFWDLGHSDKTSIWFMQYNDLEFNFIHFYQNQLQKMPHYIEYMQSLKYLYLVHNLPHDGDNETVSNITPKKQLQDAFPNSKVRIIKRPTKKFIGINAVRTVFDLCNFDEAGTSEGWQCLTNYAYKLKENGQFSTEPDHDTPWSHGADALQTFGLSLKPEKKEDKVKTVGSNIRTLNQFRSGNGWMNG